MKTKLPKRFMIACLIISPLFTMAQKAFTPSEVSAKTNLNFKEKAKNQVMTETSNFMNPVFLQKLNQRGKLSQAFVKSPLLPKSNGRINNAELPEDNVFSNGSEDKVPKSPNPFAAFKGSKEAKGNIYPPDPGGAAGPSYIMHTNNQEYVISDKTGATVLAMPVDTFWNGFSTYFAFGYPHVVYDSVLSHFYITTLGINTTSGNYSMMFGASATSDPTGNWALYALDMGPAFIQDAPQMGYSKRWFTFTSMQFDTATFAFASTKVFLMSVAQMAAGTLSSLYSVEDSNFFSISPVETQDNNVNNHYLVSNLGSDTDSGYLYLLHIGGPLAAPTYNYDGYVTNARPWSTTPVYGSQNGTTDQIWLGNTKLTNAVYRKGKIWTSHTVYLPANTPTRAAAQWWSFSASTRAVSQFGRVDDNSNANMYAFPSIAVNADESMLLGYNVFSSTTYPSAAYSYHDYTDAANSLRKSKTYKKGKAAYFDGGSSGLTYFWGNYTSACVDPADGSFWTVQEYAEKPANKWGTWWANVKLLPSFAPEETPEKAELAEVHITPNPAKGLANISWNADKATNVKIQISNTQGVVLITKQVAAQEGINKLQLNIGNLVTGMYNVTIFDGTTTRKAQLMVR